jgi:hypothetical protein
VKRTQKEQMRSVHSLFKPVVPDIANDVKDSAWVSAKPTTSESVSDADEKTE